MDEHDYFGEIAVPVDEEEEDAANDLTFGDISDIKAGDDSSEAAWKPNHQSLSSQIEAEKEALQRERRMAKGLSEHVIQPNFKHVHQQNGHPPPTQASPTSQDSAAWELLKRLQHLPAQQPQQSMNSVLQQPIQQPMQPTIQQPIQQSIQQSLPHVIQRPMHDSMPLHMRQAPTQQPVRQVHPQLHLQQQFNQFPAQQTPVPIDTRSQEYQRVLIAHQEQKTRLLLQQHMKRAEQQLQEAERARQAGITFDRKEFDRHQEVTRQTILSEHFNRVRQIQFHIWQANEQFRQVAERSIGQRQGVDLARTVEPSSLPSRLAQSPVEATFLNHLEMNARGNGPAPVVSTGACNGLNSSEKASPVPVDAVRSRRTALTGEEMEKAPRMLEIERQMAAAGLGPRTGKSHSSRDTFGAMPRDIPDKTANNTAKKSARRLESMTDRDQELVFRAHLRQIESSVLYKDDYYNTILKRKEKFGKQEVFSELAEKVQAIRFRDRQRSAQGHPIRIRGSKRNNTKSSSDDLPVAASPPHSDQNMRALANALGTVQSWNPRAPRRVMDFGLLEKREPLEDGQKSLREDERVHVRLEVERGYDVIATIHDIARGESQLPLAPLMESLISTLHLAERSGEESEGDQDRHHSTHFFATMCVLQKGRRYLSRVLEILGASERMRVMSAIFENLGMLVFATEKSGEKSNLNTSSADLFSVMTKTLQGIDILPLDCVHLLESFSASHVPHHDAFLTSFRSSIGSRLIFLCMQRISAGLSKQKVEEKDLSVDLIDQFTDAFCESLKEIFDGAESVSRVWEVVASLDALATGPSRARYRVELNRLLRSGDVPPPPSA